MDGETGRIRENGRQKDPQPAYKPVGNEASSPDGCLLANNSVSHDAQRGGRKKRDLCAECLTSGIYRGDDPSSIQSFNI